MKELDYEMEVCRFKLHMIDAIKQATRGKTLPYESMVRLKKLEETSEPPTIEDLCKFGLYGGIRYYLIGVQHDNPDVIKYSPPERTVTIK